MFEETVEGMKAYIPAPNFNLETTESDIQELEEMGATISFEMKVIPWTNWNEEWEKNFQPEIINDQIYVRAEFHEPNPGFPYELIVQPRMAFGTGHHPTTALVMSRMLEIDLQGKSLLDMGCGTGILAILSAKLGASPITAVDNDDNCAENTSENALRNGVTEMKVLAGVADDLKGEKYDVILANINRNIILQDLPLYYELMNDEGQLITSGYYLEDLDVIQEKAESLGLKYITHQEKNNWCSASFQK